MVYIFLKAIFWFGMNNPHCMMPIMNVSLNFSEYFDLQQYSSVILKWKYSISFLHFEVFN